MYAVQRKQQKRTNSIYLDERKLFFFQDSQNNKNKTKQNIVKKEKKNDDIQPTKLTSTPRPKDSTFRGYIYWTAESDCSQANICFFLYDI